MVSNYFGLQNQRIKNYKKSMNHNFQFDKREVFVNLKLDDCLRKKKIKNDTVLPCIT